MTASTTTRLLKAGDTVRVTGKSGNKSARVVNAENLLAICLDRRLHGFDWWPSSMLARVTSKKGKIGKYDLLYLPQPEA